MTIRSNMNLSFDVEASSIAYGLILIPLDWRLSAASTMYVAESS